MHSILSLITLLFSFSLQAQITFEKSDWSAIIEQAKLFKRPIFVYAYAPWCEPCQEMEAYVFTDLEVGNFYNKKFINVRMNMEQYPGVDLAESYSVGLYPSFLFIDLKGDVFHRGCGAMEASDFLLMAEVAMSEEENLRFYESRYQAEQGSIDFLLNYMALLESVCLDSERFAANYLASLALEELTSKEAWAVLASYQWDIYSREFQYLLKHQDVFETAIDPNAVQAKIYDTYLAQYQEVYASDELHGFGMRALMHSLNQVSFSGADTLKLMTNLHYAEFTENWPFYAAYAIAYVEMMKVEDPGELSELSWKFYLFVEDKKQLEMASRWAEKAVKRLPEPSIIDTYASLLFKLGNQKKAIDLATRALELAKGLNENTEHYEYQLKRFKEN
ncbi:MAG: thioredoxin family protein [Bacteroidota bacterium]